MKYRLITIIALALTGQLVNAADITDTYTAGDTLTATKMDNIKTAVNDNDSNVSTNTSNITINSNNINDSADRITALEDAGTGGITSVNAGSGLSGGGTSGDVTLSLSGAVSVHGAQFVLSDHPVVSTGTIDNPHRSELGLDNTTGLRLGASANISLPDGVTVKSILCGIQTKAGVNFYEILLSKLSLDPPIIPRPRADIFLITETLDTPTPEEHAFIDDTAESSGLIDNTNNAYAISTTLPEGASIRGCSVRY